MHVGNKIGSRVEVKAKGDGGIDEMKQYLGKDEILFGLVALFVQETQKYVFLTWVGESAPSFDTAKVVMQKPLVSALFQVAILLHCLFLRIRKMNEAYATAFFISPLRLSASSQSRRTFQIPTSMADSKDPP